MIAKNNFISKSSQAFRISRSLILSLSVWLAFAGLGHAQYTILHNFPDSSVTNDGQVPDTALIKIGDYFYGTTQGGGANGDGTLYKMDSSGTVTIVHSFDYTTLYPLGDLIHDSNTIYGVTTQVAYSIQTDGTELTGLKSFGGYPNPSGPEAGMIELGTKLYGTLSGGNAGNGSNDAGAIYSIDLSASPPTTSFPYGFTGTSGDGTGPEAALVYDSSSGCFMEQRTGAVPKDREQCSG